MIPIGSKAFLELALAEAFSLGSGSVSVQERETFGKPSFPRCMSNRIHPGLDLPFWSPVKTPQLSHDCFPSPREEWGHCVAQTGGQDACPKWCSSAAGYQSKDSSDSSRARSSPSAPVPS